MIKLGIPLRFDDGLGYPIVEEKDRFKHLFILGSTGAGKTTYFLNLIKQEIGNGIIVLDPNGDLAERVASLASPEKLIYIDKNHPISLNPLTRPINKSALANEFIETVNTAVNALNPGQQAISVLMAKIIRNAIRVFAPEQMNIQYLGDFLEFDTERKKIRDKYWMNFDRKSGSYYLNKEQVESAKRVSARLSLFVEDENLLPFVTGENELDIPRIAKDKNVVVFNLYGFDDEVTAFIGCLVTHQIKSYYMHQATKQSPPLYFYCDEYHLFMSSLFKRFLAEARKYNISVNLAGHNFSQVSKEMAQMVLSSYVLVCLRANADDIEVVSKQLNIRKNEFYEIGKHEAILGIGNEYHGIHCYPPPDIEPYIPPSRKPVLKEESSLFFLKTGWIEF